MQFQVKVDKTVVTFLVDDDSSASFRDQVRESGVEWLREARRRLPSAIAYSTKAMVEPMKVASVYWDLLYFYFGIPLRAPTDSKYRNEINSIIKKIQATSIGLNGDVTIGDISQLAGLPGFAFKCMNGFKPPSHLGLVYRSPLENAARYLGELSGKAAPSGVTVNPFASPIYINFERLLAKKQKPWYGVCCVIHEATHKFAEANDEQYFSGVSAWSMFNDAIIRCSLNPNSKGTYDLLRTQARKLVKADLGTEAFENVQNMARDKALNNADGLARYAYDVAEFAAKEELEKAVQAVLRSAANQANIL